MKNEHLGELFQRQRCGKCCTQVGLPYDPKALPEMVRFSGIEIDELLHRYYGHRSVDARQLVFDDDKRKPYPFLVSQDRRRRAAFMQYGPKAVAHIRSTPTSAGMELIVPGQWRYMSSSESNAPENQTTHSLLRMGEALLKRCRMDSVRTYS